MNLFELQGEWHALNAAIDDADGEMTPEVEARFLALDGELTDKVGGYIAVIRSLEAEAAALKAEEERMRARRKARENTRERLRGMLLDALVAMDVGSVKTPLGSASVRAPSASVDVYDAPLLAARYPMLATTETVIRPDKAAIAKALELGDIVGARLVTGAPGLVIR